MVTRITIANLIRSMALFAISFTCFRILWQFSHGLSSQEHMVPAVTVVALSSLSGAIAAIVGKGVHGVFWCLVTIFYILPGIVFQLAIVEAIYQALAP